MDTTEWPESWLVTTPGATCPNCGEQAGRPILWGLPTSDVGEALKAGTIDILIGGCIVSEDDQTHECRNCHAEFTPPSST